MTAAVLDVATVLERIREVFARVAARPTLGDEAFGDLEIYDGPAPESGWANQWLAVGMPTDADQQPVTVQRTETGAGPRIRVDYDVACAAYVGAGDETFDLYRDQAAVLIVAVDEELSADRTLGGVAARASVTEMAMTQTANEQGYGVVVAFTVTATVLP